MALTVDGKPYALMVLVDPSTGLPVTIGGGGGGGGTTTIADGGDVAQGSTTDPAWSGTGAGTVESVMKAVALAAMSSNPVSVSWSGQTIGISGQLPAFANPPAVTLNSNPAAKKQVGSLSAVNDTVVLACDGYATIALQLAALTGTPTGAAVIEASQDSGTTWFPVNMVAVAAGITPTPTNTLAPGTAAQNFETAAGSFDQIRVRCTTAFSAAQPVVLGATTGGKSVRAGMLPGENHIGEVGGNSAVPTATLTRQANTTTYASGQAIQPATAIVLSLAVARKAGGTGRIARVRLSKSSANITNASFRVHLFKNAPTTLPADAATFIPSGALDYIGSFDVTMDKVFTDGAKGVGMPGTGSYVTFDCAAGSQAIYALLEARAAYAPASGEVFTVTTETDRD